MRHYATAPRAHELPVLLASMRRHCAPFRLYVLAWDFDPPRDTADMVCTTRGVFLAGHPEFRPENLPGRPRSTLEQVTGARWAFLATIMRELGEPVTLVDGDLWFMADPAPVFAEIGAAPAAVTSHRFARAAECLPGVTEESHGKYSAFNAGFTYLADPAAAQYMAEANRKWSYADWLTHPDGRVTYGDQGHLEPMADRFGAHLVDWPVNIGPWSIHGAPLARGTYSDAVFYGGRELVAYHFSSLRLAPDGSLRQLADPAYEVERAPGVVELVYAPYLLALQTGDVADGVTELVIICPQDELAARRRVTVKG